MAKTLKITDGTASVDLIDSTGFALLEGGWDMSPSRPKPTSSMNVLADSSVLRNVRRPNVMDKLKLKLSGTSHDNLASQLQTLNELLVKAEKYHTTPWQTTPVYLEVVYGTETGSRFALLYWGYARFAKPLFEYSTDQINTAREVRLETEREPYWSGTAPGTLPTGMTMDGAHAGHAAGVEQFVFNSHNPQSFSHIFIDDGGVFGSNQQGSSNYDLLPATPAVNDAVYFGDGDFFGGVLFDISTAAVDITGQWEFWNGSAWVNADVDGADGTNDFKTYDGNTGQYAFYIGDVENWALTTVAAFSRYWVRFRVLTIGASPAPPKEGNQPVAVAGETYIGVNAVTIDGDAPALTRFWFSPKVDDDLSFSMSPIGEIMCGLKSRGLTSVNTTHFMAGGPVPTNWDAIVLGTDAASIANENYPSTASGGVVEVTFATVATIATRLSFRCTNDAACDDWVGSYQVFALCYQVGGVAGDVEIALRYEFNNSTDFTNLDLIPLGLLETDAETEKAEVVNLGRMDIPAMGRGMSEDHTVNLTQIEFGIRALSNNGSTPNLYIAAVVLIPVDELSFRTSRPEGTGSNTFAMTMSRAVVLDSGVVREGAQLIDVGATSAAAFDTTRLEWMVNSDLPHLPPDKNMRLFFLPISSRAAGVSPATHAHYGFFVRTWVHERWHTLRGAD